MNNRRIAIITGISLILMAVIAGFSIGYAYPEFYKPEQLESFKSNILNNQVLYNNMLIGILIILILDLLVSYTLYKYFENDNRKISLASAIIRMIYTLIFGIATFYLTKNINEVTSQSINTNFQSFELIWNSGLIIFGFHILLVGALMKLHRRIPKILWYLTIIAGVSYIFVHILKLTSPNSEFVMNLEMILALPMALGELGLSVWLLIKGGKKPRVNN
jgi:magnesium-transporting ATPase (P-type)